jgi:hypothetical protein
VPTLDLELPPFFFFRPALDFLPFERPDFCLAEVSLVDFALEPSPSLLAFRLLFFLPFVVLVVFEPRVERFDDDPPFLLLAPLPLREDPSTSSPSLREDLVVRPAESLRDERDLRGLDLDVDRPDFDRSVTSEPESSLSRRDLERAEARTFLRGRSGSDSVSPDSHRLERLFFLVDLSDLLLDRGDVLASSLELVVCPSDDDGGDVDLFLLRVFFLFSESDRCVLSPLEVLSVRRPLSFVRLLLLDSVADGLVVAISDPLLRRARSST